MGNKSNCCKGNEANNSKCCGCFNCECKCNCFKEKGGFCGCCNCCSIEKKNQNIAQIAPSTERQIPLYSYSSSYDSFFKDIEGKYNILTYIQLIDYINLLEYYCLETF